MVDPKILCTFIDKKAATTHPDPILIRVLYVCLAPNRLWNFKDMKKKVDPVLAKCTLCKEKP